MNRTNDTDSKAADTLRLGMAAALFAILMAVQGFSQPAIPTGPWKDLFNEKDFTGWRQQGNPPWSIAGGIISAKGGSTKTFLIWPEPVKDMELEIKYKLSTTNANGGIQIRSRCADKSKTLPDCGGTYQICGPQLDVAQSYSGRLFEECAAFLQFDGQNIDNCRRTLKVGDWTTTTARIDGAKVSLWLNGTHCLDYTFTNAEHLEGSIFALQSHPPYDLIEYDYVKMRKLNVLGCTNPKATNYNPEATKDDGKCIVPSGLAGREAPVPGITVSASSVSWTLPAAGRYRVRLVDVNGSEVARASGYGPVSSAGFRLGDPGIYFLEIESAGRHSRHRVDHF